MRLIPRLLLLPAACAAATAWATCPPLPPEAAAALTVEAVRERVPLCHPDVLAAERALDAAGADVLVAGQRPNPQLSLGAATLSRHPGGGSVLWGKAYDRQVRVDQLVERGGKPALRVATAQAQREAARADLAETVRQATFATLQGWYELAAAQARREELAASAALNRQSLQAFEQRVKSGDAAPLDASRFEVDALRVQADQVQADTELKTLRQQLALALGAPQQAAQLQPRLVLPATALAVPQPEQLPMVVAAQARVQAAERARELARAQRTRDVSVGVQFDRYPVTPGNDNGTGNTVSLFASVPLFVRHAFEGDIARAEADVGTAAEMLRRARAEAQDEVVRAQAAFAGAQARRRLVQEQLLPAAERVAEGAELAFRRGASGVLEVLDARRALRAAQVERINAEAALAQAAVALQAVSGAYGGAPAAVSAP